MSPLALALSLAAAPRAPPPPPPRPVSLPAAAGLPQLAAPSLALDGRTAIVVRTGSGRGQLWLVPLDAPRRAHAVDLPPGVPPPVRAALSPDGARLAVLAGGELWLLAAPGAPPQDPVRLYPPREGDAPLGTQLAHFVWSMDDGWILLQSPLGWARVALDGGAVTSLPPHPVDLTGGCVVLGGDGVHAAFVRPTFGSGWINGAKVIALNLETGQAQVADFDHDYTELLALKDAQLAGMDASGKLWVLRGKARVAWFEPPPVAGAASIGDYTLNRDGSTLAYVVSFPDGRAQLWVGAAPKPPPWPKRQ